MVIVVSAWWLLWHEWGIQELQMRSRPSLPTHSEGKREHGNWLWDLDCHRLPLMEIWRANWKRKQFVSVFAIVVIMRTSGLPTTPARGHCCSEDGLDTLHRHEVCVTFCMECLRSRCTTVTLECITSSLEIHERLSLIEKIFFYVPGMWSVSLS